MTAQEPLLLDVVANAYKAGFEDPRFGPMTKDELSDAELGISVLSTPRPLRFADEADLLRLIRPDRDGLILRDGDHRGLFLPSVWQHAATPVQFLEQLKCKAGLPADHRSDSLQVSRFTAESFGAPFRAD